MTAIDFVHSYWKQGGGAKDCKGRRLVSDESAEGES